MSVAGKLKSLALGDWAHIVTIVGVIIGAGSLYNSANEARSQSFLMKEEVAHQMWLDYMNSALAYPEVAESWDATVAANADSDARKRYAWHTEKMLFAAELILENEEISLSWRPSIIGEIQRHNFYFSSCEFQKVELLTYGVSVQEIVYEALGGKDCVTTQIKEWQRA